MRRGESQAEISSESGRGGSEAFPSLIEALNAEFATAFWAFVEQGEYEIRHASKTG